MSSTASHCDCCARSRPRRRRRPPSHEGSTDERRRCPSTRSPAEGRTSLACDPNRKPPPPVNPALLKHAEERAENAQNRAADHITAFSGSMLFVYIHMLWFGLWIGLGVEKYPFGLLTMIVSLEAIIVSRPNG